MRAGVTRRSLIGGLGALAACGGDPLSAAPDVAAPTVSAPTPPPAPPKVHAAVGPLDGLSTIERRLYVHPDAFSGLGPARKNGWRDRVHERGQSFADFSVSAPNWPQAPRGRLYLLPLGTFPNEMVVEPAYTLLVRGPEPSRLAQFLERFYGVPVTIMDPIALDTLGLPFREREGHRQYDITALFNAMAPLLPADAYSMTAILNRDLYAFQRQEYAFGYGLHRERLAVMSGVRFDPSFSGASRGVAWRGDIERRTLVVLAHEVGHTFGMRHCTYYRCVLNGLSHVPEVDATPLHLCPVCLRKLLSLGTVDARERYERLEAWYRSIAMNEPATWVAQRLMHLQRA